MFYWNMVNEFLSVYLEALLGGVGFLFLEWSRGVQQDLIARGSVLFLIS
jgi:hypothetical protein